MLELRSLHSLRGINDRNIAAQVADMIFTTCIDSEAIVNVSKAAVVMDRSKNDAFAKDMELYYF